MLHAGRAARVQQGGAAVPRGTHTQDRAALSGAALALLLLLAAPAAAQPTGLAPYRYATPYGTSPLDQEKARVYQDQLRHDLPRDPPADATSAARGRELSQELDRVDHLLERRTPPAPTVSGENPTPERGPVTASGGHAQPTPAEIEERERAQRQKPPPPTPLKPVYDLFGQRLQ